MKDKNQPSSNLENSGRRKFLIGMVATAISSACAPLEKIIGGANSNINNVLASSPSGKSRLEGLTEAEKKLAMTPPTEPVMETIEKNISLSTSYPDEKRIFEELTAIYDSNEFYRKLLAIIENKKIKNQINNVENEMLYNIGELQFRISYNPKRKNLQMLIRRQEESDIAEHRIVEIIDDDNKLMSSVPYASTKIIEYLDKNKRKTYAKKIDIKTGKLMQYSETVDEADKYPLSCTFNDTNNDGEFDQAVTLQESPDNKLEYTKLKFIKNPATKKYKFDSKLN